MTELETLQNAVTTAQTAYDNAVKTFNVSKKKKADEQALQNAENALEDAKFDLDDYIENSEEPQIMGNISISKASEGEELPAKEANPEAPVIHQRGRVADDSKVPNNRRYEIHQRGKPAQVKQDINKMGPVVIQQRGKTIGKK